MKERIVIKDEFWVKHFQEREKDFYEEDLCSGGNPEEWWHYEKEQVPETYEELRSLCIEISTKEDHIHIFNDWGTNNEFLMTHSLKFYPDGTICVNGDNEFIIAKNKTVAEMWNIIRALLEVKK